MYLSDKIGDLSQLCSAVAIAVTRGRSTLCELIQHVGLARACPVSSPLQGLSLTRSRQDDESWPGLIWRLHGLGVLTLYTPNISGVYHRFHSQQ